MKTQTTALLCVFGLALSSKSFSQGSIFNGYKGYPQYRQISGLSGGGYGLSFDGYGSVSGATAFSTPLGYTLGHDEIRISGADTFFNKNDLSIQFKNTGNATGKAFFTYGHSFGNVAVTYTYFIKSYLGDASSDLQVAYVPRSDKEPGYSVGVQDLVGNGGAGGPPTPGVHLSSRSIFVASTYAIHPTETSTPIYVTAGVGTNRFSEGFASTSFQVAGPLRLWAEYDGFGINAGVLLSFKGSGKKSFETNLLLGEIKGQYPTIALTFGF